MREIFNVANSKWGTKRMCLSCGQRFFDMRRELIVCPSCDAPVECKEAAPPPEPLAATEDGAQTPAEDTEMAAIESEEADSDIEVEEESAETIEDPSELGEDEDDMAEVIEGIEQPKKKDV